MKKFKILPPRKKASNRSLNRALERERKQRSSAAIQELRTYLPKKFLIDILNKLKVKTCTTDYNTCHFPQHLILEAIVEYISELHDIKEQQKVGSFTENILNEVGMKGPNKKNIQFNNVEVQTESSSNTVQ